MTTPNFGLTTKQVSTENDPTLGRKFDVDKNRWDLLPWNAAAEIVKVLTFGARKYAPNNWRYVPEARDRYFSALHRHMQAWWGGEKLDPETGLPHLAHAGCCLLFLLSLEQTNPDFNNKD
jgi:hypothetical protein